MLGRYRNYHQNRILGGMSKKYHDFVDNMQITQRLRQLGRSVKLTLNCQKQQFNRLKEQNML